MEGVFLRPLYMGSRGVARAAGEAKASELFGRSGMRQEGAPLSFFLSLSFFFSLSLSLYLSLFPSFTIDKDLSFPVPGPTPSPPPTQPNSCPWQKKTDLEDPFFKRSREEITSATVSLRNLEVEKVLSLHSVSACCIVVLVVAAAAVLRR